MRYLILAIISLFTFKLYALDFQCTLYSLTSSSPRSTAVELDVHLDLENKTAEVSGNEHTETGALEIVSDSQTIYKIAFGSGADTLLLNIILDPNVDVLSEYVKTQAQEGGVSDEQAEQIEQALDEMFDGIPINGTQVVLAQVSGFLSCKEK